MDDKYDFDIQASPKCLEMLGWDELRKIANGMVDERPMKFYPGRWFHGGDRSDCPETLEVTWIEHKGRAIMVLPYVDDKGIRVISFDPNRDLHGLYEGHHRMGRK